MAEEDIILSGIFFSVHRPELTPLTWRDSSYWPQLKRVHLKSTKVKNKRFKFYSIINKDTNRKTSSDIIIIFVFRITLLIAFAGLLHPHTSKECYSQKKTSSCQTLTEWIKKSYGNPRSQLNPCIIKANAFPSGLLLVCWAGF